MSEALRFGEDCSIAVSAAVRHVTSPFSEERPTELVESQSLRSIGESAVDGADRSIWTVHTMLAKVSFRALGVWHGRDGSGPTG